MTYVFRGLKPEDSGSVLGLIWALGLVDVLLVCQIFVRSTDWGSRAGWYDYAVASVLVAVVFVAGFVAFGRGIFRPTRLLAYAARPARVLLAVLMVMFTNLLAICGLLTLTVVLDRDNGYIEFGTTVFTAILMLIGTSIMIAFWWHQRPGGDT